MQDMEDGAGKGADNQDFEQKLAEALFADDGELILKTVLIAGITIFALLVPVLIKRLWSACLVWLHLYQGTEGAVPFLVCQDSNFSSICQRDTKILALL